MEQDSRKYLTDARSQLIEQRRLVIRSLAFTHDREQLEAHIGMIMKLQEAIKVIDQVMREESAA